MKRLTIFSLEAVIRYSDTELRGLFFQLLADISSITIETDPAPQVQNLQQLLVHIFKLKLDREPSEEEVQEYQKAFKKAVKKLYVKDEEAFEVRPGVQSLFAQLEKEKRWKYGVVSDYWGEATQFILQACGIFSKNKLTMYAEDAASRRKQTNLLLSKVSKEGQELKKQFVCLEEKPKFLDSDFKVIRPRASDKESNYYVYPKFSELLGGKKKKRKKVK